MELSAEIHSILTEAKKILLLNPNVSKEMYLVMLGISDESFTNNISPDSCNERELLESCNEKLTNSNILHTINQELESAEDEEEVKNTNSTDCYEKKSYIKTSKEWKNMVLLVKKTYQNLSATNTTSNEWKQKELYDAIPKFLQISKKGKVEKITDLPEISEKYFTRQIRGTKGHVIYKKSEKEFENKIPVGFLFSDKSFIFF
jgi:hypothetical protein